jgi:hypothetical protein
MSDLTGADRNLRRGIPRLGDCFKLAATARYSQPQVWRHGEPFQGSLVGQELPQALLSRPGGG